MPRSNEAGAIYRSDHPPGTECGGTVEEVESGHAITILEQGSFGLGHRKNEWWLTASSLFVSRPGARYRYTHRVDATDVCLTVAFNELTDIAVIPPRTNALTYLWWRLPRVIATGDAMRVDGGRRRSSARCRPHRRDVARQYSFADLASMVGMSAFHFNRVFSQLAGMSPQRFEVTPGSLAAADAAARGSARAAGQRPLSTSATTRH